MNNEMPDEIYVEHSADEWVNGKYVPLYEGGEQWDGGKTKYIRADKAVPEGWKLVPIEPTEHMLETAYYSDGTSLFEKHSDGSYEYKEENFTELYEAMLSAAPQPPTKGD